VIIRRTLSSPSRAGSAEEESVFEEFLGLPAHPLVVHAAVVFVPLLVIAGLVHAFVPRVRGRVGWAALLLAVAAPLTAFVATQSGEALQKVFVAKNYPPQILDQVAEHQRYGDLTFWFTLGLGLSTALLVAVTSGHPRLPRLPWWVSLASTGGIVIFGILSAAYIYLTGESGAEAVWSGTL
jgi:hypothetical protein